MKARGWSAVLIACLGAACATVLPRPNAAHVIAAQERWPALTEVELTRGLALYQAKCGGCHLLYAPSELTPHAWEESLVEMGSRAKLTPDEHEAVLQYLWATSAEPVRGEQNAHAALK